MQIYNGNAANEDTTMTIFPDAVITMCIGVRVMPI